MTDIHSFEPFWGTWRIVRVLGQGSYGKVYLVQREDLGGVYYAALKHLSIPADPSQTRELYADGLVSSDEDIWKFYTQMLNTLINEIKVNDRLKGHTNIVSYEEHMIAKKTDTPGFDVFIRMEFLTSLSDYIQQQSLTMDDAARLGEDICSALMVLKRERIVHRDIKPANIFVNKGGDFKLGDFGVARTMDKTVSSMSVKGTFAYMAPEVAKGEDGSFGVDIYSLGLVMYKLLNGNRAPFLPPLPHPVTHDDTMAAQKRRFQGEPVPPPAYASPALADIVVKACAYQPAERWSSPEEMRDALRRYRALASSEEIQRVVLSISKESGSRTIGGGSSVMAPSTMGSWNMPTISPIPEEEPQPSAEEDALSPSLPEDGATVMMSPEEYPPSVGSYGGAAPTPTPEVPAANLSSADNSGGKKPPVTLFAGIGAAILTLAVVFLFLRPKPGQPTAATPVPEVTQEVSLPPTASPRPTPKASPTPEPSAETTVEPAATAEPTPSPAPKATVKPSAAPRPTQKPKATPAPKTTAPAPEPIPTQPPVVEPAYVAVTGLGISQTSAMLDMGSSLRLSASVSPANATDSGVSWSSSNSAVASVDASGNVSSRGTGTAVITASCGGFSASCSITVN